MSDLTESVDYARRQEIADECRLILAHAGYVRREARLIEEMPGYGVWCMSALDEAITALQQARQSLADKAKFQQAAE